MKIIDNRIEKSQCIPEFEKLLDIYGSIKPKYVLEIGSLMGWSLHHWIYYAQEGATVISLDLPISQFCGPQDPRCSEQEKAIKEEWPVWAKKNKTKLYLIKGASQQPTSKEQLEKILGENKLDFIFIDGNHFYEYVKQDFEIFSRFMRKGGVVAFHDIAKNEEGTVNTYWEEIKKNYKYEEITLHPNQEKGIGVLYI